MPRNLAYVLVALVGILAGALAVTLVPRPEQPIDSTAVRTIVAEMLAERDAEAKPPMSLATIDPAQLNPMIEDYLMSDPKILQRVTTALNTVVREEEAEQRRVAIASITDDIFHDPDQIVLGNPDGDVTLVEMFDYNCGYCRSSLPDMLTLLDEDPNLRVVLKEFPILSPGSMAAAQVGVLVNQSEGDYLAFHEALFTSTGPVTADTALATAETLGLNPVELRLQMESEDVGKIIQKSYDIADALNISGTPTYIIGDEVIPGAIGIDELRSRIANMRACGKSLCPQEQG